MRTTGDKVTNAGEARTVRIGLVGVAAFNLILLAALVCDGIPDHPRVVVEDILQSLGLTAALIFAVSGTWRGSRGRLASLFLALGAFGYMAGQTMQAYGEIAFSHAARFPGSADAAFLAAYPFLFLGILTVPAPRIPTMARLRVLFDSLMLIVALVAFSWYFVLGPTLMQNSENLLAWMIGTAFPLSDLVLISCVSMLFLPARDSQIKALAVVLTTGLCAIIASDSVFDFQTLHNSYSTGHPTDLGWTIGYMLIGVAARMSRFAVPEQAAQEQTPTQRNRTSAADVIGRMRRLAMSAPVFVPYAVVPAVGALVWHTARAHGDIRLETGVYVCAALLMVLLLVRQSLMVLENQQLALQMRGFNEKLEREVADRTEELHGRTEQLAALHHLTVAVNETLVLEQVASAAAWHLRQVLQADAAVMWTAETDSTPASYPIIVRHAGLEDNHQLISYLTELPTSQDILECRVPEVIVPRSRKTAEGLGAHYLQVALRWQGQALGRLGVVRLDRGFSQTDTDLLESVALQVATALENARQFGAACEAADRDPITGLWNHRAINQYLTVALDVASSQEEPLTIIMTDLDNFKLLNDTYGHTAGDQVLQRISQILTEECGGADRVGRYGGDEFLIVLSPGKTQEDGITIAQRLRDRVLGETFQHSQNERTIPLGLSFGVASFPRDSQERHDLLRTADANLAVAKSSDEHVITLNDMQRSHRELRSDSSFRILDSLVTAVDNKDHYTRRHSEDVTTYSLWIAEEMGLPDDMLRILRTGGLLHDVGKIGVPDEILRKPSKLTDEEYDAIKQHPVLGAYIVAGIPGMDEIVDIVRHHHERWDGRGYPNQLACEDIPLLARIVAVADAVSAMTTDRPYRKGMDWRVCLAEVDRCSGTQFDPEFAAAFKKAAERRLDLKPAPATRDLPKAA